MQHALLSTKQWFISRSVASFWLKALLGANIIALSAQITIPMYPVPMTAQTLALTIVGFALGARGATMAVLLYLLEGCAGLPVFAGGASGYAVLMGKTGGYLLGFIPSAFVLGYASDKGCLNSLWKSFGFALLSAVITFAFGLIQLNYYLNNWEATLVGGLYPFILGGMVKAILASVFVIPTYNFFKKI